MIDLFFFFKRSLTPWLSKQTAMPRLHTLFPPTLRVLLLSKGRAKHVISKLRPNTHPTSMSDHSYSIGSLRFVCHQSQVQNNRGSFWTLPTATKAWRCHQQAAPLSSHVSSESHTNFDARLMLFSDSYEVSCQQFCILQCTQAHSLIL